MKAEVIREKVAQALCASQSGKWDNIAEMARDSWRLDATVLRSLLATSGLVVVDLAELEAALKPFAAVIEYINEAAANSADEYDKPAQCWTGDSPVTVKLRDCTTAAALLAALTREGRG